MEKKLHYKEYVLGNYDKDDDYLLFLTLEEFEDIKQETLPFQEGMSFEKWAESESLYHNDIDGETLIKLLDGDDIYVNYKVTEVTLDYVLIEWHS
jgi:hypothetical protein